MEGLEELRRELAALREEVGELRAVVARLQSRLGSTEEPLSRELLFAIAAAVCAYLGKHARIRSVRYVPAATEGWSLQGRAMIHASHHPRGG